MCRCLKDNNKLIGGKREVPRSSSVRNSSQRFGAGKSTWRSSAGKITQRSGAGKITQRSGAGKITLRSCKVQGESLLF